MAYYTGKEIEQDLTAACEDLSLTFSGGPYVFDFHLDPRSNMAECYITNEGIEPGDPEDIKDVIHEHVGSIIEIYDTEMRMGEYDFQILVGYNPL